MLVCAGARCVRRVLAALRTRARDVKSRAAGSPPRLRSACLRGAALGAVMGKVRVCGAGFDHTWWRDQGFRKRVDARGPCGLGQVFMAENSLVESGILRVK